MHYTPVRVLLELGGFIRRVLAMHSLTAAASFEYMKNEGERLLLEALDELEVLHSQLMAIST